MKLHISPRKASGTLFGVLALTALLGVGFAPRASEGGGSVGTGLAPQVRLAGDGQETHGGKGGKGGRFAPTLLLAGDGQETHGGKGGRFA